MNTVESRVKMFIGDAVVNNLMLTTELEKAQLRIKELEENASEDKEPVDKKETTENSERPANDYRSDTADGR